MTAWRVLREVARAEPATVVPYLHDARSCDDRVTNGPPPFSVRTFVANELLNEYGDDELSHVGFFDVMRKDASLPVQDPESLLRWDAYVARWDAFARGVARLPRRRAATLPGQGRVPLSW